MKKIQLSSEIKEKCPNLILGYFSCEVHYETENAALNLVIQQACEKISNTLKTPEISQLESIASSRQAYKNIGNDPSRYRLSAEALLRRVVSGKGLYQINNIVDTLNLVSIQTGYSIGGYDTSKIEGDITLGIGEENEPYDAIGKGAYNINKLPVFRDNLGAFGTPTSDSTRTMVTENTKSFLMLFLNFGGHDNLQEILDNTATLYQEYCNANNLKIAIIA